MTSVWWHGTKLRARLALTAAFAHSNASCDRGQGLSPAVSTPIGFHGSSLICRICHCRGGLLWGGDFKPRCYGSQASSLFYGYFGPSLTIAFPFPDPHPALSLSRLLCPAFSCGPSLSFHLCLRVRANLKSRG